MTTISAPGKVHLIGEHSVVYGKPAIIAAVGLRCHVDAEKSDNVIIESADFGNAEYGLEEIFEIEKKVADLWKKGNSTNNFSALFEYVKTDKTMPLLISAGVALKKAGSKGGIKLKIKSEIPIGSGMGSSSAIAVTISKAAAEIYGREFSKEEINSTAFEIEKINHGNPSGGDNSACCYGGFIWFQKKQPKNIITPFMANAPEIFDKFLLLNVGRPVKTTGELVQAVRDLPEGFRIPRLLTLEKLTHEMKEALGKKDTNGVKDAINDAQQMLSELGVSTDKIDKIASDVRNLGGAAKLCGAGGGGTVLCFHENSEELKKLLKKTGFAYWDAELGAEGVRIERL